MRMLAKCTRRSLIEFALGFAALSALGRADGPFPLVGPAEAKDGRGESGSGSRGSNPGSGSKGGTGGNAGSSGSKEGGKSGGSGSKGGTGGNAGSSGSKGGGKSGGSGSKGGTGGKSGSGSGSGGNSALGGGNKSGPVGGAGDGSEPGGGRKAGPLGEQVERYLKTLQSRGRVVWAKVRDDGIEVRYSDGWSEQVTSQRYRLRDPVRRIVIERAPKRLDFERLRAAAR